MATIFFVTALAHLAFAGIGSFYRYEAYLLALGAVVIASQLSDRIRRPQESRHAKALPRPIHAAILVLAVLLMAPLVVRGGLALSEIQRATANIFQQQYQMGLFVRQFYQDSTVALNDIGAVSFLADIRCLDLWGLATPEVMKKKMRKDYHTKDIGELIKEKGARIAIVYDNWFGGQTGGLPRAWTKAVQASEFSNLVRDLREFSSALPKEVTQTGRYTENLTAAR